MSNILLLAPPAAGKGTQAELLQKKYEMVSISTGDLLREASKEEDEIGFKIKELVQNGKFVDDETVLMLLKKRFQEIGHQSFLLDGFPRNIHQAQELEKLLDATSKKLDYVFLLEVPKEVLEKRITGRRLCSSCGKIHNIYLDACLDKCSCGGELMIRGDDTPEVFQTRYQAYLERTAPLVEYYEVQGVLYRIDANRAIQEVFSTITSIIESGDYSD